VGEGAEPKWRLGESRGGGLAGERWDFLVKKTLGAEGQRRPGKIRTQDGNE